MWFAILECNFKAASVTASLTKFTHVTALLPPDVLTKVSDVVSTAVASSTPYEDLKAAVLARLQSTVTARLQELLCKEELGDEKPSDLLRRMKLLLGDKHDKFDQDLFHHLFYQRLPVATQRSLFSVKSKLSVEELAQLADDFMATLPPDPSVASVTAKPEADSHLVELVSKLALQVADITRKLDSRQRYDAQRSRSPRRFSRRPRSSSRPASASRASASASGPCYYHRKFGTDAHRCRSPCTFATPILNQSSEH